MIYLKALGLIVLLAGLTLTLFPTLSPWYSQAEDLFYTIEKRVLWGGVLGLGIFLLINNHYQPWYQAVLLAGFFITSGIVVARLCGLAIDGFNSPKQWIWTGIEFVIAAVIYYAHYRLSK